MGKWSQLAVPLALICALAGCSGCNNSASATKTDVRRVEKPAAIPVEAQLPTRGALSEFFETTTRVQAERKVQVTSEGVGKCLKVHVDEGDRVEKGDVLAELDTSELKTQISSATTQLQKAKSDYERARKGLADGIMPKVDYDNAKFAYEQQQANLEQLNVQLANMTIRAPMSGIVTKKMAQAGQIISTGSPCFEVIDPQSYMLTVNAPEKDYLSRIKTGQKAIVKLDALAENLTAKVRKINPAVDETTGTVKVTLDFDKASLSKLRDNAFARVSLVLATHENTLMVPKEAVVEENARKYVFVIERQSAGEAGPEAANADGGAILVAERREIQTGLEDSANVEVVSGITEDNAIVTVGQQTLKSGAEVKLTSTQDELLAKVGLSAAEALKAAEEQHQKDKAAAVTGQ